MLKIIDISRKTKQRRDRENGGATNTHESKWGGWSELRPSCDCRDAASALPLCPMVGWVPLKSCSRGMAGGDLGSNFSCDWEGVDIHPGEALSCAQVVDVWVPIVPGCKEG